MVRALLAAAILVGTSTQAQAGTQAASAPPQPVYVAANAVLGATQPAGPSMEETTAWLESEGHDLMRADRLQNNQVRLTSSASPRGVELITLANCVLYVRMADLVWPERTYDLAIVLRELRPGGVRVEPDTLPSGYPVYTVRLYIANPNAMSTIYANGKVRAIRVAGLPVQGAEDGQRIANAITHAATLCGASDPGAF